MDDNSDNPKTLRRNVNKNINNDDPMVDHLDNHDNLPLYNKKDEDAKPKKTSKSEFLIIRLFWYIFMTFSNKEKRISMFRNLNIFISECYQKIIYLFNNFPKIIKREWLDFMSPKFYHEDQLYGDDFSRMLDSLWIWSTNTKDIKRSYTLISFIISSLGYTYIFFVFIIIYLVKCLQRIFIRKRKPLNEITEPNIKLPNIRNESKSSYSKILDILKPVKIPIIDDIFGFFCYIQIRFVKIITRVILRTIGRLFNHIFSIYPIIQIFSPDTEDGRSFVIQKISNLVWLIRSSFDLILLFCLIALSIYISMSYYRVEYISGYVDDVKENFIKKARTDNLIEMDVSDISDNSNDDGTENYFRKQGKNHKSTSNNNVCSENVLHNIGLLELDSKLYNYNKSEDSVFDGSYQKIMDICFVLCAHFDMDNNNNVIDNDNKKNQNKVLILDIYRDNDLENLKLSNENKKGIVRTILAYTSYSFLSLFQSDDVTKKSETFKKSKSKELFEYMTRTNEKIKSDSDTQHVSKNDYYHKQILNNQYNIDISKCENPAMVLSTDTTDNLDINNILFLRRNMLRLNSIICDYSVKDILNEDDNFKKLLNIIKIIKSYIYTKNPSYDFVDDNSCNLCNSLYKTHKLIFSGKFSNIGEWRLTTFSYGNTITYFDLNNFENPVGLKDIIDSLGNSALELTIDKTQNKKIDIDCHLETFKIHELTNLYNIENSCDFVGYCHGSKKIDKKDTIFYQSNPSDRLVKLSNLNSANRQKNTFSYSFFGDDRQKTELEFKNHKLNNEFDKMFILDPVYKCNHEPQLKTHDVYQSMGYQNYIHFYKSSNNIREITKYFFETYKITRKRLISTFIFFDKRFSNLPTLESISQIVDSEKLEPINFYSTYLIPICNHYKFNSFLNNFLQFYTDSDVFNEASIWNPLMGINNPLSFRQSVDILEDYYSKTVGSKQDKKIDTNNNDMIKSDENEYLKMFKKATKVGSKFVDGSISTFKQLIGSVKVNYNLPYFLGGTNDENDQENKFTSQMELERFYFLRNLISRKFISKADSSSHFDIKNNTDKASNPLLEILFLKGIHNEPIDNIGSLYKIDHDFFFNYPKDIHKEWNILTDYILSLDTKNSERLDNNVEINMCICSLHNFIPYDMVNVGKFQHQGKDAKNINILNNFTKPRMLKRKSKIFESNLMFIYKKITSLNSQIIKRKDGKISEKNVDIQTNPIIFADDIYNIQNLIHTIGNEWRKILKLMLLIPDSSLRFPIIYEAAISNTFILEYFENEIFSVDSKLKNQCKLFDDGDEYSQHKNDYYVDLLEILKNSGFDYSSIIEKYVNISSTPQSTNFRKSISKNDDFFTNMCIDYCNTIYGISNDIAYMEIITDLIKVEASGKRDEELSKLPYYCDINNRDVCDHMWRAVGNK